MKSFDKEKIVFLSYFFGLVILRIFSRLRFFSFFEIFESLIFVFGGLVGWWLLKTDRLVSAYFLEPQTQLSYHIRYLVEKFKPLKLFRLLRERKKEQKRLVFRSAFFQVGWLFLAFFTITSTTSFLAKGMVLGLGLHLLFDEIKDWRRKGLNFVRDWLFWQIKRTVTLKEAKIFLWIMISGFVFLSLIMI